MDYIGDFLNLGQFNEIHKNSFFLHSKMHIFIHLANSLKFLEELEVTHMDLSVNNVIVTKEYMIKLIDFGEAYH